MKTCPKCGQQLPEDRERDERRRHEFILYTVVAGVVAGQIGRSPWWILIGAAIGATLAWWKLRRHGVIDESD